MKKQRCKWLSLLMLSIATLLVMGGCGGGGGGGATAPKTAKISGAVTFPSSNLSLNALVGKRVGLATATDVSVAVFDLAGKQIGDLVHPEFDETLSSDQRIYSYAFTGLTLNQDYVIKATKSGVVLKKLIEKKDVVESVVAQSIDSVSTAAVIVASQTLGVVLGDPIPAGSSKTVAGLSTSINTEIKPVMLEGAINAVLTGGAAGVTTPELAELANVYNIVVTAGSVGVDPAVMFTDDPPSLGTGITVPILDVAPGATTATVTQTVVDATVVTSSAEPVYTPPTESAATYTGYAKNYLAKQDISNAALNYEKALSIDANDPEANFGGAITSGMMLIEDPDVQAIITKWGAVVPTVNQVVQGTSPIKLPFDNMTSIKITPKSVGKSVASAASATTTQNVLAAFSALKAKLPQQKAGFKSLAKSLNLVPATAPSIDEMQTLIDNVIIPRIDKINARLAIAEAAPSFTFTVTTAMQGNPLYGTDVVLDAGELYTLDAALNIFQVLFKIATSYNFDIPAGYTYDTIGQDPLAMINSPSVFTLKTGGAAKMAGALANAKAAAAKAKLAYDIIEPRSVLPAGKAWMLDLFGWTQLQKDDFVAGHTKVTAALAGQYDILDSLGAKIVTIDATKFFTNPLTRADLPAFGYDVQPDTALSTKYKSAVAGEATYVDYYSGNTITYPIFCDIVPMSDLPDYSLNGILPGNTAASNVAEFNGILPVLSGKLLSESVDQYMNSGFVTDGTSIYFLKINYGVAGGVMPSTYEYVIKKIDPATGTITTHLTVTSTIYAERLFYNSGKFYLLDWNGSFYPISGSTVATSPEFSVSTTNGYISSQATSGTDTYYVLNTQNMTTYASTAEIHKVSGTTDTILFTVSDYVDKIAFSNGHIYIIASDTEKWTADGNYVATYITGASDWNILVGGYFYSIYDGKIIKSAGTPAGGTAKAALAKYFGF